MPDTARISLILSTRKNGLEPTSLGTGTLSSGALPSVFPPASLNMSFRHSSTFTLFGSSSASMLIFSKYSQPRQISI